MYTNNNTDNLYRLIAKVSDISLKPWKHSVVESTSPINGEEDNIDSIDISVKIQTRDVEGQRIPERDIEVEIFKSGTDFSITLSWLLFPDQPILWYGTYSIWMDPQNGKKCTCPSNGSQLEILAKRLRASLII